MSQSEGFPHGIDPPPDPLSQLIGSVVEVWGSGLQVLQGLAGMGVGNQANRTGSMIGDISDAWQRMARPFEAFVPGSATHVYPASVGYPAHPPGTSTNPGDTTASDGGATYGYQADTSRAVLEQVAELGPAIAQAYIAGASSSLRYFGTLAELMIRYEANLMRAATDRATGRSAAPASECRVVADDLRALLREIGDAVNREARRLEQDLGQVSEQIAQATDRATPSPQMDANRRWHEAKR